MVCLRTGAVLLTLTGCGRFGFTQAPDAAALARTDGATDGATDAIASCDPMAAWSTPTAVTELDTTSDEGGLRLSADALTGYLWRSAGSDKLYTTTRSTTMTPFDPLVLLANVNGGTDQEDPAISDNGLTLIWRGTSAPSVGGADLYWASRASPAGAFTNVALVPIVNSTSNDVQPGLGADGLYFASDRNGAGGYDLYRAPGSITAGFATPAPISELDTASDEEAPVISADLLTLYFSSDRAGSIGGRDIWVARRGAPTGPFGNPARVTELSSSGDDSPTYLSPDNCLLYLIVHPTGGNADIYQATRSPM